MMISNAVKTRKISKKPPPPAALSSAQQRSCTNHGYIQHFTNYGRSAARHRYDDALGDLGPVPTGGWVLPPELSDRLE